MSRIGKHPIPVPAGVEVSIEGNHIHVKGPKGELDYDFNTLMTVVLEDGQIVVTRPDDSRQAKSFHGLTRTLIANMVEGVSNGFQKKLELVGVGYRAALKGSNLEMQLGYSHPVIVEPPAGITFEVPDQTHIVVNGADKQQVGETAAVIRKWRKPEPYKGKGIRYEGEVVRRKLGKAAKGDK
ncbi:50S ribosomal protein L6 [Slackia equolifaciens]|uniref:Large ribosomal subunit protein uL6 n=1 Tax=Slackia equolifaciens TaxID=498718 RepID=A0A3N0B344_9ACTN|nr:50S ribosomal protein L6 [Slackia equolifaciens]RNL41502.1 50S ribosomal protein L6 [Slackia equolifaciens]HJF64559.1 50S ribosomal protein L6 [Slackia equolifaciens]